MGDLEAESSVGEGEDVGDRRPETTGIGDDDDVELEPFRRVDRQQAHRVGTFLLRHGVGLLGADGLLPGDEANEPLEIRAAQLLVRSREARELAEVRVPPLPVGSREHREVVVVLAEHSLAEELEGGVGRELEQAVVPLPKREQHAAIVVREVGGQSSLDAAEDRLAMGVRPDQDERVVRDTDERRCEHGQERLVVVAVVEEPQIREQVDDLLLTEVAAPSRSVGRKVERAELLLEPLRVGACCEEEDDLPGRRDAGVDELADTTRDVPRLGAAPMDTRLTRCSLVRDEQLDRVPERRLTRAGRRLEALELVAELGGEELVHRFEHLGPGPVVLRQREDRRRRRAALTEDRDVGVAEAVDRLELVAHDEQIAAVVGRQKVEQLGLQAVRVLELVHHDRAEPLPLPLANGLVVTQEVARAELEILEVEGRLAVLRVCVRERERREQLLEELAVS